MESVEFLRFIVSALVENESDVEIERQDDDLGTLLKLKVNRNDMGTLIGKEGKTINAIRTVLRSFGSKQNLRLNLKIIEE